MSSLVYLPFILFSVVAVMWVAVALVVELQVRARKMVVRAPRPRPKLVLIQGGKKLPGPVEAEPESRIA